MSERKVKMVGDSVKMKIYNRFQEVGVKTKVAEEFSVSPRTVGRIINEIEMMANEIVGFSEEGSHCDSCTEVTVEDAVTKDENTYEYFYISTSSLINITRVCSNGEEPASSQIIHSDDPKFDKVKKLLGDFEHEEAYNLIDERVEVSKISHGLLTLHPDQGILEYDDGVTRHSFSASLTDRACAIVSEGGDCTPLMKFAEKLVNNPSPRAVDELYDFLVASDISITNEGMVRCYKKITEDWKDCFTRTIDNSIGATPQMKRFAVNDNSAVTCSYGLHVCSKAYLNHYHGERVVAVDVDPADFVSIPYDYYENDNGSVKAKARVCKYHVVGEIIFNEDGSETLRTE